MAFENIKRNSTTEIVINQIKMEIINGNLKPGEKIPSERELAKLLGVSRSSVREAIQALSFSGYLDVHQGKGAFVQKNALKYDEVSKLFSEISDYSLSYLMEVRKMLEVEFARLAAIKATEKEIGEIANIFDKIKNSSDIHDYIRLDLNFHLYIAKATHNPLMNTLMKVFGELLHNETHKIIELSRSTKDRSIETINELVEAIKDRNPEKAGQMMKEHITMIEDFIEEK